MLSWIGPAFFVCFVLALIGLAIWARRTDKEMNFEQAEGVAKADDGLRLGIALSSNAQNAGY